MTFLIWVNRTWPPLKHSYTCLSILCCADVRRMGRVVIDLCSFSFSLLQLVARVAQRSQRNPRKRGGQHWRITAWHRRDEIFNRRQSQGERVDPPFVLCGYSSNSWFRKQRSKLGSRVSELTDPPRGPAPMVVMRACPPFSPCPIPTALRRLRLGLSSNWHNRKFESDHLNGSPDRT